MDIGSGRDYPASALSNFAPHPFVLDDVEIASMEGSLQSLKFSNMDMQVEVCKLAGRKAKFRGKGKKWQTTGTLWWCGQEVNRFSQDYQDLLDRAYEAMFTQSQSAQSALLASRDAVLTHSIGKNKQTDTILTTQEFCSRLTRIRAELQKLRKDHSR